MELEGAAADGGVVDVLGIHVQVVGQVHAAVANRHRSGKQPVDILLGKTGVFNGLDNAFALDLELALVGRIAGHMLMHADNGGGAAKIDHRQGTSWRIESRNRPH